MSSCLLFFDHDFRGFDNRRDGIAHLKVHFDRASPGNYTLDEIVANLDNYVGHHSAELELCNFPLKPVPR